MPTSRTSIIRGPGTVSYGGEKLFDAGGINAEIETATRDTPSSICGNIATVKTDQTGKISFTPCGEISEALLALLFPYGNAQIGASACGDADRPLVIHATNGTKVTFVNAVVAKMPEIYLSPIKTAFGAVDFNAAIGFGKTPADVGGFYAVESAPYDAGVPDPSGIKGVEYKATYGDLEINDTTEGWTITPEVTLEPVIVDALGTIDWTIASIGCTATCTPLGLTEEQILAALPAMQARGSIIGGAHDLSIRGEGGLHVTLRNASLMRGPLNWGNTTLRAGQIQFKAHRAITEHALGDMFSVKMAS